MSPQSEIQTQVEELERAVELILQMESQIDIPTMIKAIAAVLAMRAQKPAWQEWFCNEFQDAERRPTTTDSMHPLEPDLV